MRNILILFLCILPLTAQARDKTDGKSETLAVQTMLCQKLAQHTPTDDVAYKPGVDVNGNAVAPADLASPVSVVNEFIEVPLTIDLAQRLNLNAKGLEMRGAMGVLRLGTKDGSVSFQGQDLTPQTKILCEGGTPPVTAVTPAAAQSPVMPVVAPAPSPAQTQAINPDGPPLPATVAPSATSSP
jgi:hypothetical protein